ncbi:MAG: hypothetical protein ACRCXB_27560 [Aeromonadaceae bacterium]
MNKLLVNISSLVNNSEISTETIEGVDFTVLPSKTLPPDIVMNGILYPADDVAKTIQTLDGSPVTLSHPVVNGKFADAYDMMSQAKYGLGGAHNKLRGQAEDGSWLVDKYIPTEQLKNTARGKKLAEAIKNKQPIHTSTGVYLKRIPELGTNAAGQEYKFRAEIDRFNHDAILLNEQGAATPEQGVGIFVNADGAREEVEVMYVNLSSGDDYSVSANAMRDKLQQAADKTLKKDDDDWLYIDDFNETSALVCMKNERFKVNYRMTNGDVEFYGDMVKAESAGFKFTEVIGKIVDKVISVVKSTPEQESIQNHNREGNNVEKTEVQEMIANALAAQEAKTAEAVTNAVTAALAANAKAQADADKAKLVEQVVNAKLMTADAAKECGVVALQEMLANQKLPAAGLLPGYVANANDEFAGYDMNSFLGDK